MSAHKYNLHPTLEATHQVVPGDSLSKIAAHYRARGWIDLADWRSIFRLTRERTGLWRDKKKPNQFDNPDLIRPGDLLLIPRSRFRYQAAIHNLEALLRDVRNRPNEAEALKKEEEHFSEGLDLANDVLTFCFTLGLKAAQGAKAAKLALGTAAKHALEEKTLSAVELGLKIGEYGLKSSGHEKAAKAAKTAGKIVHAADLAKDAPHVAKDAMNLVKAKRYWRLAGEAVGQVADVIDIALEWTEPSKLSKGMIRLFTGEDLDAELGRQAEAEKHSREQLTHLLRAKITSLHRECQLVYLGHGEG